MFSDRFFLHVIPGYISNIFLVEYEHGLLLFDCGAANDIKRIEDFCLQTIKRSPLEIKLAVVTHIHPDHSGGADMLRKKYGTAIATHKELDRWYSGIGGFIQHKLDRFMMQKVARSNRRRFERSFFPRKIKADYLLSDGDNLPGFQDWLAVHVPGHTSHDLVLFNEKESILYASDCVVEVKGQFRLPLPIMFPNQMHTSYNKMSALNAATILLAHGEAVHTENTRNLFASAQELLQIPPTKLTHRVHRMSIYSPEWWRQKTLQNKNK